ncbi:MAG: hypothetical protein ABI321_05555 [Polyangia bacterium]
MRITHTLGKVAAGILFTGLCMGSSCFPTDTTDTTDGGTGGGGPSIEVTVDGAHAGPYAAGADAYADYTVERDGADQVASATFVLHATGVTKATCDLTLQRFGSAIAPFSANAYSIIVPTTNNTPDRTASLASRIIVTGGNLTLTCGGDDCAGLFVINILDATHVEGYLTATMADPSDGQTSSVVVTFYVPWRHYSP